MTIKGLWTVGDVVENKWKVLKILGGPRKPVSASSTFSEISLTAVWTLRKLSSSCSKKTQMTSDLDSEAKQDLEPPSGTPEHS